MAVAPWRLKPWHVVAGLLICPLTVALSLGFGFDPEAWEASRPLIHREETFVGSAACLSCHPQQHETWRRTFHRTMTQHASPASVQGLFDGRDVSYQGRTARPFERDGRYYMDIPTEDGGRRTAEVVMTVGSRRYQQYFERDERGDGFALVRLPILWHIGDRRWLHMNTIFLGPDDPRWERRASRWNDNCIFCHNTAPRPGEVAPFTEPRQVRRFDSKVAELGIACETCHGPGGDHVALYRDPARRYRDYFSATNDTAIVNPEHVDKERAVSLCGQCHGQRTPLGVDHLVSWLTVGPSFRSGERLTDHVRPLTRETPSPTERIPDLFELRFWRDGTPRLTAYEYQGVTRSPCFRNGEMTCESCHTMHGGDPRGMIEPEMRGDAACLQCHDEIAKDIKGHTHHEVAGSGSRCMECHMPRMAYGILTVHRSHLIENPDPRRDGEHARPHACTTCHLDKSLLWSAEEMRKWWGDAYRPPRFRADGAPLELSDFVASLLAGDAVQRVVYAWASGRPDADLEPHDKALVRAALTATLADDYPSIRYQARRSLLLLEQELPLGLAPMLETWDHMAAEGREEFATRGYAELARRAFGRLEAVESGGLLRTDFFPDIEAIAALRELQSDHVIDIGE